MDKDKGKHQFHRDVFPTELQEIKARRTTLGLPSPGEKAEPSTELGLVGLALSGGGIRSATFSLGVIQALAKHDILRTVDYLSTVSGGGYIGSCLSTALNTQHTRPEGQQFPLRYEVGESEPPTLCHLRNSENYLSPGGLLDKMRIPTLLLRGVLTNLLIVLPLLMLTVLVTEFVFEYGHARSWPFEYATIIGVAPFGLIVLVYPTLALLNRKSSTWNLRNLGENLFTLALLLGLVMLLSIPVFLIVSQAVEHSLADLRAALHTELLYPFEREDIWKWLLLLGTLVAFMLAGKASERVSKVSGKLALYALGLLGPAVLVGIYLILIVVEIDSPYLTAEKLFTEEKFFDLNPALETELQGDELPPALRQAFNEHDLPLSDDAQLLSIPEDSASVVLDRRGAYVIRRSDDDLSVFPSFLDDLHRALISPALQGRLYEKGIPISPWSRIDPEERRDLRLMSVSATDELVEEGRSLVIVALVGTDLHIRIFDASGEKVVDKAESELVAGAMLTALKQRLSPFLDESSLSPQDKREIIDSATLIAGHTTEEDPRDPGTRQYIITGYHRYTLSDHRPYTLAKWITYSPAMLSELQQVTSPRQVSAALRRAFAEERVRLPEEAMVAPASSQDIVTPQDIVLVVDDSKSILRIVHDAHAQGTFTKETLLETFLGLLPRGARVAIISFKENARKLPPADKLTPIDQRDQLKAALEQVNFDGDYSNSPEALGQALEMLKQEGRNEATKAMVFISDGYVDVKGQGEDADTASEKDIAKKFASSASEAGIRIYGVALPEWIGKEKNEPNRALFQSLTQATGGHYRQVQFAHELPDTIAEIAREMRRHPQWTITDDESAFSVVQDQDRLILSTELPLDPKFLKSRGDDPQTDRASSPASWQNLLATITSKEADPLTAAFAKRGITLVAPKACPDDTPPLEETYCLEDTYRNTIRKEGETLLIYRPALDETFLDGDTDWVFFGILGVLLIYLLTVNVNVTAAHRFYRDRLSKAFLVEPDESGQPVHHDGLKLSQLNTPGSAAPYHLINVSLNLQGSSDLDLRGRKADFFIFSKRFTGSHRTGYLDTPWMEGCDPHLNLGTAMAISGAAAAPNMGVTTIRPLVFIMTLLNIRLGYWLPNPRRLGQRKDLSCGWTRVGAGARYLFREAMGWLDALGAYINVSDGGHLENLGIYELLRRRCKFIISVDGEADPQMRFGGFSKLQAYARIDLGIEIQIDLDAIRKDKQGFSKKNWALGTIRYAGGEQGHLLYIKSSLPPYATETRTMSGVTDDVPEYLRAYREKSPSFPHESTADQFFNETQFEAYRALGYHIADKLRANNEEFGEFRTLTAGK